MYSLPQEIEVWYIIPAVRKEMARVLVKEHGLTLEKAGGIIGVTKAAVSQYLKNKRASQFKLPKNIKKEIAKSAEIVVRDRKMAMKEILKILSLIKRSGCSCGLCKKYNKDVIEMCKCNPSEWE